MGDREPILWRRYPTVNVGQGQKNETDAAEVVPAAPISETTRGPRRLQFRNYLHFPYFIYWCSPELGKNANKKLLIIPST